jgi:hypothetical protein
MSLKTGRIGLKVPKFPPRKAMKITGTGKLRGTGKVRTKNPPSAKVVSTSQYKYNSKM